jgi:hypothetical protein
LINFPFKFRNFSLNSVYVYWFGHVREEDEQFEVNLQIRHRWVDHRLAFSNSNISGAQYEQYIEGEEWFMDRIWTPNIFIENELSSHVMDLTRKNYNVKIDKTGQTRVSYRVSAVVLGNYKLDRFPHDSQTVKVKLESCK